jgi:hypothetical protein
MVDTAFKTQYRDEFVAAYEQSKSLLMGGAVGSYVDERVISGNTATFLVAGTGGAEAVTRGTNGNIPERQDSLTQVSCTLAEWHDKPKRTNFNIFASQGNGREILQKGSIKVLNRKADDLIIDQLAAGTVVVNATAETASLSLFARALATLGEADVDVDEADKMFCVITHAARNYLMQIKEFASADYVELKYLDGSAMTYKRWMGVNWVVSNRLPGSTTATESCFMWHRDAMGFAANQAGMDVRAGYNEEEDYYFARASMFMGAKLLQNTGVVEIKHNGVIA